LKSLIVLIKNYADFFIRRRISGIAPLANRAIVAGSGTAPPGGGLLGPRRVVDLICLWVIRILIPSNKTIGVIIKIGYTESQITK
jgi:hypothetical protein